MIEDASVSDEIEKSDFIVLGYPIYFSNLPKIVRDFTDKLKINTEKCIGSGSCTQLCPMENLSIVNKIAVQNGRCTMCYRCISNCPKQAITLLGKNLYEQCKIEKYI